MDSYKILEKDDNELSQFIIEELDKKFNYKILCKGEKNKNDIFKQEQCYYMCPDNVKEIECKQTNINELVIKSRQIKQINILKKTKTLFRTIPKVVLAKIKIDDIDTNVIIKNIDNENELLYEMFISNILKQDIDIKQHICGYYGKKLNNDKLIMEYIDGKSFYDMRKLNMKDFSDIVSQLFFLLDYSYRKYSFLHGDLHSDNFMIVHDPENEFNITLFLSNGKKINYKSHYKVVLIDFGLSFIKYNFRKDRHVNKILLTPFDTYTLGFDKYIPLVDITKLIVSIKYNLSFDTHKKLNEVNIYIVNFIKHLFTLIGKPNKKINEKFFDKCMNEYLYIYELINSNLNLSFEELYVMFVSGTKMDIHNISSHLKKDEDIQDLKQTLKHDEEDFEIINSIIQNVSNENISLSKKVEKIKFFMKDLTELKHEIKYGKTVKININEIHLKYIFSTLYEYICKYEINKHVYENEIQMVSIVNKVFNSFNDISNYVNLSLNENDKYNVIDKIIEFKTNNVLDSYLKNTNINNVLTRYNELNNIVNTEIENIEKSDIHKIIKIYFIENYKKLPFKLLQRNYLDEYKYYNPLEKIRYISHSLNNIIKKFSKYVIKDIFIENKNFTKSLQEYHLYLFFQNIYINSEKESEYIYTEMKYGFNDWISFNRVVLYDFFIRYLSMIDLPQSFLNTYLEMLDFEDEIWEKFYKSSKFEENANTLTFSKNMLNILTNENIGELKKMLKRNYISNINKELNINELPYEINKTLKTDIFNAFDKMYLN
jgi:hypothetical protein